MRKGFKIFFICLLLAGGAVLCAVRWQAWFGMPEEPVWTGDTLTYVFPIYDQDTLSPERMDILVLGDIHNRLTCADYDTLAARVPQAEAVVQIGDWMDRGQEYYYQLLLHEWMSSALFGKPVIVCPGNHEYSKTIPKELSPVWRRAFPVPANGPVTAPGVSYYVDFPYLRFIVLDTNPLDRLVYLTRTLAWLRGVIDSADGRFTVAIMHHPVLSPAKGRFNPLLYAAFRHALGETDLVIAGHDHSYMRQKNFVVINAAGKPKEQHKYMIAEVTDSVPVYGVLTVDSLDLQFTIHRFCDGAAIDSLHVQHD